MKRISFFSVVLLAMFCVTSFAANITLDGHSATYKDFVSIANGSTVDIKADVLKRVALSHDTLIKAAESGHKIYGLTVGVGLNKDRKMIDANGKLSVEVINASKEFNKGLIHAHVGGVSGYVDVKTARTVMAVRLNNMLFGGSGVQEEVVLLLRDMLNRGITPIIPAKGSIGMADITILGHLGLAMIGEGDVIYKGKTVKAIDALKAENLKPIVLFGKDALSIVSSNAFSAALTVQVLDDLQQLINMSKIIFVTSLEAFNGNIVPFSKEATDLRPYKYFIKTSKELRQLLTGSYLFNQNSERALQDPLSFRDAPYYIAALEQVFDELNTEMNMQFNSSDDNPGVLNNIKASSTKYEESKIFVKSGGAVVPNANFEPVIWVLALEKMSVTLGAVSNLSSNRTIHLSDDTFTHLSRFLGTDKTVHAFGAMQKPFAALNAENLFLSNPLMLNNMAVAGSIEDVSTNAPGVAQKVQQQINNLFQIYGIELLHAAQAIDLRGAKQGFVMSPKTKDIYTAFRKEVKFLDVDRPLTYDFSKAAKFVETYNR